DAANVYWVDTNGGTAMKAPRGGGTPITLATGLDQPQAIAVDGTSVYWTNLAPSTEMGTVMKVAIGGGTPVVLANGQHGPLGIAVDATSVYWTNSGDGTVMKLTPK